MPGGCEWVHNGRLSECQILSDCQCQTVNHQTVNHQIVNHQTVNHQTVNHQTVNHQTVNYHTVNNQTISLECQCPDDPSSHCEWIDTVGPMCP